MDFRQKFTTKEWRTLQYAPFWVFRGVAEADDHVDDKEMAAVVKEIEEGDLYAEPLVNELFAGLLEDSDIVARFKEDDRDMSTGLAQVAEILDRKAQSAHAVPFKQALLLVGRKVAEASGRENLGARSVSDEEELSLFRIADILGVSLDNESE